jgi:hypothetical protein
MQLIRHLLNRYIPRRNLFRNVLQVVELGSIQPGDLVCGDFDAVF